MLVPSPAFRSMALGIMLSVVFVLAATLTLLPAVLGKLGPRVDRLALPWVHSGEHRSPRFAALGRAALAPPARSTAPPPLALLRRARAAGPRPEDRHAVDQGRARRSDTSRRATSRSSRPSAPGAPGALQIVGPGGATPTGRRGRRGRPGHRPGDAGAAGRRRARADPGDPGRRPVEPGRRRDDRPAARGAARRRAGRRRGRREPRPRAGARRRRRRS